MEIRYLDIFMIGLLIIVVSIIIGLNIVSVIDMKLGTVQINVPKPTFTINVHKTGDKDIMVNFSESHNINHDNIEHFDSQPMPIGKPNILNPETIKKEPILDNKPSTNNDVKPDFKQYDIYNINRCDDPNFGKDKPMVKTQVRNTNIDDKGHVSNPNDSNIVEYGDYVCYRRKEAPKVDDKNKVTCLNESINNRFKTGDKFEVMKTACYMDSKEDDEFGIIEDPAEFYRVHKAVPAQLEDSVTKGYNIGDYVDATPINKVGMIDLKTSPRYPKPTGFLF